MKNNPIFLFTAAILAAISGCTAEPGPAEGIKTTYSCSKIINSPANAAKESILVRVSEAGAEINSALDELGAKSFCRAIPGNGENKEKLAKYGLDKWFIVSLPEGCDLDRAAKILSGHSNVSAVQFNTKFIRASDCRSWQYLPQIQTKSTDAGGNTFSDPFFKDQWHYINKGDRAVAPTAKEGADINIKDAWRLCAGDPAITVAIIDEAVQWNHPDLSGNMWTNTAEIPDNGIDDDIYGINCVKGIGALSWDADGSSGHGTHVAGIVSAINGNNTGVCGIAGGTGNNDGVRLMSCQIFDGPDGGDAVSSARAFCYAADNHADIAQCSFGYSGGAFISDSGYNTASDGYYSIESCAMEYFMSEGGSGIVDGGLIIFAAGNEGYGMAAYPGAYKGCISVTSVASDGLPAYYTNYGPGCDIAAPGGEYYTGGQSNEKAAILSTMPTRPLPVYDESGSIIGTSATDYGYMQGTSMACPNISGIAALGLSYAKKIGKQYTRDEFLSMLLSATNGIDALLTGSKITLTGNSIGEMQLMPLRGKIGTGTIDAWKLLMNIEGTPVLTAIVGESQNLSLNEYFGGDSDRLTYTSVEISGPDMESMGLKAKPEIRYGKLHIEPTRTGSGKVTVKALVGGDSLDGTDAPSAIGVTRTISVIARNVRNNNGGWL